METIEEHNAGSHRPAVGNPVERQAPEPRARCRACGFEAVEVPGSGTVAEILGLPGAFRALLTGSGLAGPGPMAPIDDRVRVPRGPDGWSAIEYAAHVAEVLHETAMRLVLIFEGAGRVLPPPHVEAANAAARSASRVAVLASLGAGASELARVVSSAASDAWDLSAKRCDTPISARDLLGEALHEAHHHLFDARQALGGGQAPARVGTARP